MVYGILIIETRQICKFNFNIKIYLLSSVTKSLKLSIYIYDKNKTITRYSNTGKTQNIYCFNTKNRKNKKHSSQEISG